MAASSFFSNLGDTLSKTVKEVSGRAGNAYETQKIKNKISGEEKQIQKIMADIGKIVYERYTEGVPVEEAQKTLCEQIDQRQEQIKTYNNMIDEIKEKIVCPSCGSMMDPDDAFCSKCGAPNPATVTEEPEDDDVVDGTATEVVESDAAEEPESAEETPDAQETADIEAVEAEKAVAEELEAEQEAVQETAEEEPTDVPAEESAPSEAVQEEAPAEESVPEETEKTE